MKRPALLWAIAALLSMTAWAQSDVLGVHNCYGRGCIACHTPHSGAAGNGNGRGGASEALWGQSLTPLYGQTLAFGDVGKRAVVSVPATVGSSSSPSDATFAIVACLSCHDGNIAKNGIMKGISAETLPVVGGHAPTLLGNDGSGPWQLQQRSPGRAHSHVRLRRRPLGLRGFKQGRGIHDRTLQQPVRTELRFYSLAGVHQRRRTLGHLHDLS